MKQAFLDLFTNYYRKEIFSCHNALRAMDLNGGALNYTAIEVLRSVETKGVKCATTIIPSRSSLQRCAKKLKKLELCYVLLQHVKTD